MRNIEMQLSKRQNAKIKDFFRRLPIEAAYVFGSFASGQPLKNSDIDIAVLLSEKIDKEKYFDLRLNLIAGFSKIFKREADVVILNEISSLFFKYAIIKEGKLIYQKSEGRRVDFELKCLNDFFDFRPFLEKYNEKMLLR